MEHFLLQTWEHLLGRLNGPFWIRLVIQPAVSSMIGLLIGVKDARAGRPPFAWTLLTNRLHRRELLREAWIDVGRVFMVAIMIDLIYQIAVLHWVYPLQSLFIATILALTPYVLIRCLINHIVSFWLYRQARNHRLPVSRKSI